MLGNRINQYNAAAINKVRVPRSTFDRSFGVSDTHNVDKIYPILIDELYPNDTINLNVKNFSRIASPLKQPIMDNLYTKIFIFVTPMRLLWSNFTKMMGEKVNDGDSTDFTTPQVVIPGSTATDDSLWDKFDVNGYMLGGNSKSISALYSRNYNLVYREWFRHPYLQDAPVVDLDNGPDDPADYTLKKITRAYNYFSAALPEPQAGTAVSLPLGTSAPVIGNGGAITFWNNSNHAQTGSLTTDSGGLTAKFSGVVGPSGAQVGLTNVAANSGMIADLSDATAASVNSWREAVKMQEIFELDNRIGHRWVEILDGRFNSTLPDYTAQRPELVAGGKFKLQVNPVPQTSPTSGSNAQAQLAAFGTMAGSCRGVKTVHEHSILLVVAVHTGEITFQQGIPKILRRTTRFDYVEPKLQELGDQAILTEEIYCDGSATDDDVFGYIPRYDDRRFMPSRIRGQLRSNYTTPLDSWHLAEKFASAPELNDAFIQANTPIERAVAVTSGPDIIANFWFEFAHTQQLVTYGVPLTLGNF